MPLDKYKAHWLSHSSIADFLKCPRFYYLRNVYKDPKNGHKITIVTPPLSMGQAIHEAIDQISNLPLNERFKINLEKLLEKPWKKIEGKRGGFKNKAEEDEYKQKAIKMLKNVSENPGPLAKQAIKIKTDQGLAHFWLSQEENIILCGKIDWIEYLPDTNSVHLIDFKTGKNEESEDSLQLPVYLLLASNLQKRKVEKASYWYLLNQSKPKEVKLPKIDFAFDQIMNVAKRIKLARQINLFKCPKAGCFACRPLERVLNGEAEKVAISDYNQDIYILSDDKNI